MVSGGVKFPIRTSHDPIPVATTPKLKKDTSTKHLTMVTLSGHYSYIQKHAISRLKQQSLCWFCRGEESAVILVHIAQPLSWDGRTIGFWKQGVQTKATAMSRDRNEGGDANIPNQPLTSPSFVGGPFVQQNHPSTVQIRVRMPLRSPYPAALLAPRHH